MKFKQEKERERRHTHVKKSPVVLWCGITPFRKIKNNPDVSGELEREGERKEKNPRCQCPSLDHPLSLSTLIQDPINMLLHHYSASVSLSLTISWAKSSLIGCLIYAYSWPIIIKSNSDLAAIGSITSRGR